VNEEDEFNFDGSRSDISANSPVRGMSTNSDFEKEESKVIRVHFD